MDITFGVPVPEEPAPTAAATPEPPEPIIRTSRLLIRPYCAADATALQNQADDVQVSRTLRDAFPNPYTLADAEKYLAVASPDKDFAIFRREADGAEGAFIGGIGLKSLSDVYARGAELGYWVGRASWGQGLATEAVAAFSRWVFERFPELLRLEGLVYEGNVGSARVLEKNGFIHEGTRRKAAFKRGQILDERVYGLLRDEQPTPPS